MTDRVVEVQWDDACSDPNWLNKNQIGKLKAPVIRSYGVIVRRDARVLVLAHSLGTDENGTEYGVTIIPSGMVRKVRRI